MVSTETLSAVPIFQKLPQPDLEVLLTLWKPKTLREGEILFRRGDAGSSMFIIEDGSVEITVPALNLRRQLRVAVLHDGEFLGELALVDGLPRTATARALKECSLIEMNRVDFMEFLMQRPAVAISMVSVIGQRLRETDDLVTSLASKNVNEEIEERLTFGEHLADRIAEFGGSWTFISIFGVILFGWMALNTIQWWFRPFDEYPFIFLNLMLSCLAAIQAPIIMMSQNRAQKKDRLRSDLDYQVNLKSELLLQELHTKIDEVRANELQEIRDHVKGELEMLKERFEELERGLRPKKRVS